jgi:hypothetical protein
MSTVDASGLTADTAERLTARTGASPPRPGDQAPGATTNAAVAVALPRERAWAVASAGQRLGLRIRSAGLAASMAIGSLGLWTVLPVTWLWMASNIMQSNLFSYMFALIGCPISMVVGARWLYGLQRRYDALRDASGRREHTGWLRSISDERRIFRRQLTLLDVMMCTSVLVAVAALALYYLVFSDPLVVTGPYAPGNEHGQ